MLCLGYNMGFDLNALPDMTITSTALPPSSQADFNISAVSNDIDRSNNYWLNTFIFAKLNFSFNAIARWDLMPQGYSTYLYLSFDTDYLDIDSLTSDRIVDSLVMSNDLPEDSTHVTPRVRGVDLKSGDNEVVYWGVGPISIQDFAELYPGLSAVLSADGQGTYYTGSIWIGGLTELYNIHDYRFPKLWNPATQLWTTGYTLVMADELDNATHLSYSQSGDRWQEYNTTVMEAA